MGCDIHGAVEIDKRPNEDNSWWQEAGRILPFVDRSYDSFGTLFGVRNYSNFDPVAPNRGIPEDVSRTLKNRYSEWGRDAHSASYITFEEILEIDWDETASEYDSRYTILDEYMEETGIKFALGPASGWIDIVEENREKIDAGEAVPSESGDSYIQRVKMTREEAISGAWDWLLHDYMGLLADRFGVDAVRLVVWFDN